MTILLAAYMCKPNAGSENAMGWNNAFAASRHHDVIVITAEEPGKREAIDLWLSQNPDARLTFHYVPIPDIKNPFKRDFPLKYFVDNYYYSRRYVKWSDDARTLANQLCSEQKVDIRHHVSYSGLYHGSCLTDLSAGKLIAGPVGSGVSTAPVFLPYLEEFAPSEKYRTLFLKLSLAFPATNRRASRFAQQSSVVLCANAETQTLAKRLGSKATQLAWDGSLTADYRPTVLTKSYEGPLNLLWVGSLRPPKGLTFALDVLGQIKDYVDFHMHILGDGFLAARVPGWLESRGLTKHVTFHGRVGYDELRAFYSRAHLLLFSSFRDNGGNQLLEAMCFGVVPIAFCQGGAPILFDKEQGGVLVHIGALPDMINDWKSALVAFDEDRNRLRCMSEHAHKVTWNYEPEQYAGWLDQLYRQISGGRE